MLTTYYNALLTFYAKIDVMKAEEIDEVKLRLRDRVADDVYSKHQAASCAALQEVAERIKALGGDTQTLKTLDDARQKERERFDFTLPEVLKEALYGECKALIKNKKTWQALHAAMGKADPENQLLCAHLLKWLSQAMTSPYFKTILGDSKDAEKYYKKVIKDIKAQRSKYLGMAKQSFIDHVRQEESKDAELDGTELLHEYGLFTPKQDARVSMGSDPIDGYGV